MLRAVVDVTQFRLEMFDPSLSSRLSFLSLQVIPLSSLANVGPADIAPINTSSWGPASWWRGKTLPGQKRIESSSEGKRGKGQERASAVDEIVPILALSYWIDGSPR